MWRRSPAELPSTSLAKRKKISSCKEEKDLPDLETLGSSDKESLSGKNFDEEGGEKISHHVKAGKGKDGRNRKKKEGANQ